MSTSYVKLQFDTGFNETAILHEGQIEVHKNTVMGQWKKRYAVLKTNQLVFFKTSTDFANEDDKVKPPKETINLTDIETVTQHVKKTSIILLKFPKSKISVKSEDSHDLWFNRIKNAVEDSKQQEQLDKRFDHLSRQIESRGDAVMNVRRSLMTGSSENLLLLTTPQCDELTEEEWVEEAAVSNTELQGEVDLDDERIGFGSLMPRKISTASSHSNNSINRTPNTQRARLKGHSKSDATGKTVTFATSPGNGRRHYTNPEGVQRNQTLPPNSGELAKVSPNMNLSQLDSNEMRGVINPNFIQDNITEMPVTEL